MMNYGRLISLLFLLSTSFFAKAQIDNIGEVVDWKSTATGIEGQTQTAFFKVSVYSPEVIRVRVSQRPITSEFSYVLDPIGFSDSTHFLVKEKEGEIFLNTDSLELEIFKKPAFRVVFTKVDGTVISEDMPGEGFGTTFNGERSNLYKKMHPGERFVGLGEVLGNLDKRGNAFTLNNTDTYKYGDPRLPMYVSIPFFIGIRENAVYGFFYHNTYQTFFNFGLSTPEFMSVTAWGGDVDYFMLSGKDIPAILRSYTGLTGRMPLPPRWSLGYHQSRCSYFPDYNVLQLAKTFRSKHIPIDCIVLDADYLFEYEPFRINTRRFPDMKGLTAELKNLGIEVTASVNPGIKRDSNYFAHHEGLEKDVFVKYSDGRLYTAEIAPSLNNFVDFTKPSSREWWAEKMKFLADNGIYGIWNDMNEPAVGGSYLPDNLLFDFDGRKAGSLEAKNLYGMLMARSSYESALHYGEGRRPFVLSRSGFAGIQRYAAVWTGDNTAKEEYLPLGTLLNAQLGLSGLPFVGDDLGGYIGNTSKELFIRWVQTGIFSPFVRNHKEAFATANEPWSYGEEAEAIARTYIGFRYRLMPYLYSAFYEASQTAMPIVRSLCIEHPFEAKVFEQNYQSEFLFGDAILVAPLMPSEKVKKVFLPEGDWYDLYTDKPCKGNQEISMECPVNRIPLFVKASAIIPVQSLVQSTNENPSDTLVLHVFFGTAMNHFHYYEDDGKSFDYKNGKYLKRTIAYDPRHQSLVFEKAEGSYTSHFQTVQIVMHGFDGFRLKAVLNGKTLPLTMTYSRLIDPLEGLSDLYDTVYFQSLRLKENIEALPSIFIPFSSDEMSLKLIKTKP